MSTVRMQFIRGLACALAGTFLWCTQPARAEGPDTITYHAYLSSAEGVPLDGPHTVTFRIYDVENGGTPIWTETYGNTTPDAPDSQLTVSAGLLVARLGSVVPFRGSGTSDSLMFDVPYYVGVEIGSDGEMTPRTLLTGSAFAFNIPRFIETIADCTAADPAEHDSIQAIVDGSSSVGLLLVNIDGMCQQNVRIRRDRVVLRGINLNDGGNAIWPNPPHGIVGQMSDRAAIIVDSVSGVAILNLHVDSASNLSGDAGVAVWAPGSAYIEQTRFTNARTAVDVSGGGRASINDSDVRADSYGVGVWDGAQARVADSLVRVDSSDTGDAAAVGASRGGIVRIRGNSQLLNYGDNGVDDSAAGGGDNGRALSVYHGVTVRQDRGHTKFVGGIEGGNESNLSLRDPEIHGDIRLGNTSTMDVRNSSAGGDTFFGTGVRIGPGSLLSFSRSGMSGTLDEIDVYRGTLTTSDLDATVTGNVRFTGPGELGLGDDADVTVKGALHVNRYAEINLGPRASLAVEGDFGAHDYVKLGLWGTGSRFAVGGNFSLGQFSNISLSDESTLISSNAMNINDFSLMFATNDATIQGDIFACSFTKLNWYGSDVSYTGNLSKCGGGNDSLTFGLDLTVDGTIDCNGDGVSINGDPTFVSGGFRNCSIWASSIELGVVTVDDGDPVRSGDPLAYTSTVVNASSFGYANNALLEIDVMGTGTAALGAATVSTTSGTCDASAFPAVVCSIGNIPAGGTVEVVVSGTATGAGTLSHSATIRADQTDPSPGDNNDVETAVVNP